MRTKLANKVQKGAKITLEKFNKELESSEHAVALKSNDFRIPPMFANKDVKT